MRRSDFRQLISQAISELPEFIVRKMDNVAITIEDWPGPEQLHGLDTSRYDLLGLYLGIPLTERTSNYNFVLPDRIIIYQKNIESRASSVEELKQHVKETVIHEVAHHFGISDAELKRFGL